MNKKVVTLIVLILVIAIAGIIIGFNLAGRSENTNKAENETSNERQINTEEVVQTTNHVANTETVANFIHEAVGGDIIKLETEEEYTDNYNDLLDIAQEEKNKNARPALKTQIDNIDEYDTIFLGYPIWWGDMPMALYTFLDEYDLNGKTIAPFTTSGGSGLSGTLRNIEDEEPNATVTEGLAIRDDNVKNSQNTVIEWLSEIGF